MRNQAGCQLRGYLPNPSLPVFSWQLAITLCNHALWSTQAARCSTPGKLMRDTAGRQVCYKEETPVLTGLEKLVGPAMTALPSVDELQTRRDIGGSQSCCSHTPALHQPVGRERKVRWVLAEGEEQDSFRARWEKPAPPSSVWPRCWQYPQGDQHCHCAGYSDTEVIYRNASLLPL